MSKPVLAAGLLAAMAGAWWWALSPPSQLVVSHANGAPVGAALSPADVPAVRLADLGIDVGVRPAPDDRRNPFVSAAPAAPAPGTVRRAASSAAARVASSGPPPPSWPRLELIGVAEARNGNGVVRTAIVSGPHGVYHAHAGDLLEQVYRVERIGGDGIDVRLLPEDRVLRLALRP